MIVRWQFSRISLLYIESIDAVIFFFICECYDFQLAEIIVLYLSLCLYSTVIESSV